MMDRRSFIGAFMATATLDPEKLLWVPGRKSISIPKSRLLARQGVHHVYYFYDRGVEWAALVGLYGNVHSGDTKVYCIRGASGYNPTTQCGVVMPSHLPYEVPVDLRGADTEYEVLKRLARTVDRDFYIPGVTDLA